MSGGRPRNPVITQVMKATQTCRDTDRRRVKQWRAGIIDCDALFAPCGWNAHKGRPRQTKDSLVAKVMAATGLTRGGAIHRIMKVRSGYWPEKLLMAGTQEVLDHKAARTGKVDTTGKVGAWGGLGLGPRRSVASIPGGTAWERENLGV